MGHGDGRFGDLERAWAWQGKDGAAGVDIVLGLQGT